MRLGERGRRGRPGAGRGESLLSLICIEISNKRFRELSVVSFMHPQHPCKYSRNINNALGPSPRGWGELAAELKEATAARTNPRRVERTRISQLYPIQNPRARRGVGEHLPVLVSVFPPSSASQESGLTPENLPLSKTRSQSVRLSGFNFEGPNRRKSRID